MSSSRAKGLKYEVIRENRMISLQFSYIAVGISSFKQNARRAAFTDVSPTRKKKKYIYIYIPVLI